MSEHETTPVGTPLGLLFFTWSSEAMRLLLAKTADILIVPGMTSSPYARDTWELMQTRFDMGRQDDDNKDEKEEMLSDIIIQFASSSATSPDDRYTLWDWRRALLLVILWRCNMMREIFCSDWEGMSTLFHCRPASRDQLLVFMQAMAPHVQAFEAAHPQARNPVAFCRTAQSLWLMQTPHYITV
jgi:hypothetical protein